MSLGDGKERTLGTCLRVLIMAISDKSEKTSAFFNFVELTRIGFDLRQSFEVVPGEKT